MGLHDADKTFAGRSLFFRSPTSSPHEIPPQDTETIETYIRQTAARAFDYLNQVISLETIKDQSFAHLKTFICSQDILKTTHQLLRCLEQTKMMVLDESSQSRRTLLRHSEREFLSAYLIATKSEHVFESPTDIDRLLLNHANNMIKSFEALCQINSEVQTDFMLKWKTTLQAFHQAQSIYYETFATWKSNHRTRLAQTLIKSYLKIESTCFGILTDLDPRQLEYHDTLRHQQTILRGKIKALLGIQGLTMLDHDLQKTRATLEANKWTTTTDEVLWHELALNPTFELTPDSYQLHPHQNLDEAIAALAQEPLNLEPILDILEEIREQMTSLTPNNTQHIAKLQQTFSRPVMRDRIDGLGLEQGLYSLTHQFIEQIKTLEAPVHELDTIAFQRKLLNPHQDSKTVLKQTLDFFYRKLSQIKLEICNFRIKQARTSIAHHIVEFEQAKFQERLAGKQFNLMSVLDLIDSMVKTPKQYRLNPSLLCSQYVASYVTFAMVIEVLQRPGAFDLQAVPETFYLDRVRLLNWHRKYQHMFYTASTLAVIRQQYSGNFFFKALLEQQAKWMALLEGSKTFNPKDAANQLVNLLNLFLTQKEQTLSELDKNVLTKTMEAIYSGRHPVAKIIHQRLGDQLWRLFSKGDSSEASTSTAFSQQHELQNELNQLGQEIMPLIQLHVKVHGEFYRHNIEERLWKPLFVELKGTQEPHEFSTLLSPQQALIRETQTYIHKMAFLLTGLALIQQKAAQTDMWNWKALRCASIKELANSFSLIHLLKNPHVSEDQMTSTLIELMKHVADEQELTFEESDKTDMIHMLELAKTGNSPGYKSFLSELLEVCKQFVIKGEITKPHQNQLLAEFIEEVKSICDIVKNIIVGIKEALVPHDTDPIAPTIPTLRAGNPVM